MLQHLALLDGTFLGHLQERPDFYFSAVIAVMLSIVLHELGHGFAAIWQGDNTPRELGHITWDPMVHMGGVAIGLLFVFGISYGAMPVSPHRFRSKYGDALVAFAGPAVNMVLAFAGLTILGLWLRTSDVDLAEGGAAFYIWQFLFLLGTLNIVLFIFNLLPFPPLDGATVLGNLVPAFKRFSSNPDNQPFMFGGFLLAFFMFSKHLFPFAYEVAEEYVLLLSGRAT